MKDLNEEQLKNVTGGSDDNKKFAEDCTREDERVKKCVNEKSYSSEQVDQACIELCNKGLLGRR